MAIDKNKGLPLQKHFISAHACSQVIFTSNESTDRYFHTVSNWGKKHNFGEKRHLLEEFNMADKDKKRDKCYMHACMHA